MRKAEAQALWDQVSTLAAAAIGRLEDDGVVERSVVPDTDDAIAEECLREVLKMVLGPGNVNHRLAAARLMLAYTKPSPPTVAETRDMLAANRDVKELMAALLGSQ
jgi:hypothetical protein